MANNSYMSRCPLMETDDLDTGEIVDELVDTILADYYSDRKSVV